VFLPLASFELKSLITQQHVFTTKSRLSDTVV